MYIWWGPELVCFYNDAYSHTLGPERHPGSLGCPGREVWAEIWPLIGDQISFVMEGLGSTWDENRPLPITRNGRREDIYWTYSYSPIDDETAPCGVGGVLVVCAETTQLVRAERRQAFSAALELRLRDLADASEVIGVTSEALGRHLGVDQVGYAEVELGGETVIIQREWNGGAMESNARRHQLDLYGPTFIADLRRGATVAVADVRLDPRTSAAETLATFNDVSIRAFLDVPLVKTGELVAVLAIHSATPRDWSPDEVALAEKIAEQTWAAAERVRAEAARDRAAALGAAQNRVLELAVGDGALGRTLEAIVATVEGLSETGVLTSILLVDEDGTHLRHGAAPGLPETYNTAIDGIAIGPAVGSCGTAAHRNEPVFVPDIASNPLWADFKELALEHGLRSCWSIPIRSGQGGVLGTFAMYHREPREPTADDLHIIDFVVRTASLVIERSNADAALSDSEARLRFIAGLEGRLLHSADASEAMQAATEILARNLGASRCAYADVDLNADRFWIRHDYTAPGLQSSVGAYSLDLFGPRAASDLRGGRALVVCDVAGELAAGEGREMFHAIGIDAIICCPLIKDGRLAAMMAVHQNRPRKWTSAELSLVKEVVERCWAHVERVGAEARLRESEERLRLAVDNAEIGFWDVDEINGKLIWPPATKAMFGISADAPVSMDDFYAGLHPDDLESTGAAYAAAADPVQRALYDVEYRTVGKEDGVVRWVAAKGRGVFDAAGRCLRVTGTAVQITARKEAEEALRELNATLEARVTKAIAEREEAQEALRQSQKMEAMGQLTGGVAHDFNNLLTPIVGSLDMLQRKGLGGEREQRLIAGAAQSAERAKTLVQRLLAFARRQPLQPVPVDVAKLVTGMGDLVASTTGPQIRVAVEAAQGLPAANADPNQLEMAILNLAVNARDAMPEGGTLRISAGREAVAAGHRSGLREGDYIWVSVADTGSGMDEATLARATEPFFSTKGVGKGTGLGLSMVHGLASQQGGALTIQSRPGLGTNVELWLPQSADTAVAEHPARAPSSAASGGTALLVDDEELVRISTAEMLHELGYNVIEAASAEEAMRLVVRGDHFDLLITDHLMPGMNGTDLATAVRSLKPHFPVLVISGFADNGGVPSNLCRLTKPFRRAELAVSLEKLSA